MTALTNVRLVSYQAADGPRGGLAVASQIHDLETLMRPMGLALSTTMQAVERWDAFRQAIAAMPAPSGSGVGPIGDVQLLTPLMYPRAMFCAGANYTDHVAEMAKVLKLPEEEGRKESDKPWHYLNLPEHTFVGPGAPFHLPSYSAKVDWEAELGVVIGRTARNVTVGQAMEHVAGLTIVNDLSARDWVGRPETPVGSPFHWDWVSQKSWEDANAVGPWLVPLEAVSNPAALGIECWVNGVCMQDSNTSRMIFGIAEQIAHLSTRLTLRPGDLIATGTPAGVGMARGIFLKPGDEIVIRIEQVGELRNLAV